MTKQKTLPVEADQAALQTAQPSALETLLRDPEKLRDFPVETVERLYQMDKELRQEQAKREFIGAFHRVQSQLGPVRKAAKNTHTGSMYARAEDVDRMLSPLLRDEGFTCSHWAEESSRDDELRIVLKISHIGGHSEQYTMPAPIDDKGAKGNAVKTRLHGAASTLTYCVRHLKCNVFSVQLTDDDDGNAGAGVGPSAEKINEHQAADLEALIVESGANRAKFYDMFSIKSVEEMPVSSYRAACRMLEARRNRGAS